MSSASTNYTQMAIGIIIAVGLIFLPFLSNGVFFPHGQLILDAILLGIIVVGIVIISTRQSVRQALFGGGGIRIGDIAVLLLTFLYIIAVFYAASMRLAVEGALTSLALLIPYLAFRLTVIRNAVGHWVGIGFVLSSIVLDIVGLANGWGQLRYPSAIEITPHHQIQIASVFQYHNAFAVFAASVATGLSVWSARSNSHWLYRMLAIGIASLNVMSLLASGSRGALAIWVVVMILCVIGMRQSSGDPMELRNRFLGDVYIGIIGGFGGYILAHHAISASKPAMGWASIVIALFLPMLLSVLRILLWTPRQLLSGKRGFWTLIGIGIVLGLIGAIAKWHSVVAKLQSYNTNQLSVSQRFIFWGDGLKIFARNPVSGSGSGAWQTMYQKVQSYPYISTRVHSFGMDVLMETGILGFVCLVALAWPLLRQVAWQKLEQFNGSDESVDSSDERRTSPDAVGSAFVAAGLMLIAHSMMDWDMSFEYLMLLFFAAAGVAAAKTPEISARWLGQGRRVVVPLGFMSLAGVVISLMGLQAEALGNSAKSAQPSNAMRLMASAHHWAPYDDSYLMSQVKLLLQGKPTKQDDEQAVKLLRHAEHLSPFSTDVAQTYAEVSYNLGNYQVSYEQARRAANDAPFMSAPASLEIRAGIIYGFQLAPQHANKAKQVLQNVVGTYHRALHQEAVIKALPAYLPPSSKYSLDQFSIVSVAASELALGEKASALPLAQSETNSNVAGVAPLAHLIVAMVQRPQTVNSFVAQHPSVASSYSALSQTMKRLG